MAGVTQKIANRDSRAKALAGMNKGELIKTIKALDKRQTQLLNQIAKLEAGRDAVAKVLDHDSAPMQHPDGSTNMKVLGIGGGAVSEPLTPVTFPWNASLPSSFDTEPK